MSHQLFDEEGVGGHMRSLSGGSATTLFPRKKQVKRRMKRVRFVEKVVDSVEDPAETSSSSPSASGYHRGSAIAALRQGDRLSSHGALGGAHVWARSEELREAFDQKKKFQAVLNSGRLISGRLRRVPGRPRG